MDKEQRKELIDLKNQIKGHFNESDWLELGFALEVTDIISKHPRLLRSLGFGDDDYEAHILVVLEQIIKKDISNFQELKSFISNKFSIPPVTDFISTANSEIPNSRIVFAPQVFAIPTKEQDDTLIAVMMPFKYTATFDAIKTACASLNLDCKKAGDIWVNSTIIQDIFELIFTSKVVIADFTGKNPNVFYEVGIAHTLGKTVIPITQNIEDVPSDLRQHRVLRYLPNKEGYNLMIDELKNRLKTLMEK